MKFHVEYVIRFQHCDPAGIVFYPRYYEMLNQVVEDWFARGLGTSFAVLAREKRGIPLVHADVEFLSTSRIGDLVTFELRVARLGTKSFTLHIAGSQHGQVRLQAKMVMVHVHINDDLEGAPIPGELRKKMEQYLD